MCAQSESVRHFARDKVQARCVVATTVQPHSCRVGRALLLSGRHLGWERMSRPGLYCPSGERDLS